MEVQTAVAQIVPTLGTSDKRFEGCVYANHNWIWNNDDHHVSKSDRCQVRSVVHACYEKHADLVLDLNQEETKYGRNWKTHELFYCIRDFHDFFWSAVVGIKLKRCHAFDIGVCFLDYCDLIRGSNSLSEEIVF